MRWKTIRLQVYTNLQTGVAPLGEKNRMSNQNVDVAIYTLEKYIAWKSTISTHESTNKL